MLGLLARGYTREDVLRQYPHLTLEDIQACLSYAEELVGQERVIRRPA